MRLRHIMYEITLVEDEEKDDHLIYGKKRPPNKGSSNFKKIDAAL